MAFDSTERSNASGKPVELFEIIYGSKTWRYAGYEENLTINKVEWQSLAISSSGFKMSGEPSDNAMTVTCDASIDVSQMLNGAPPSEDIWVQIRRYHHGDDEAPITWIGYIASRKQISKVAVELVCKPLTAGFDRDGARLTYGRQCPHVLYGPGCTVNKDSYAVTVEIEKIAGNTIYSAALADLGDGYLNNGFFRWQRFAGAVEMRGIENHVGQKFTILGTSAGLEEGTMITVFPGCNRTRSDCIGKFNNLWNFGGFAHLPGDSPFSGDPVF